MIAEEFEDIILRRQLGNGETMDIYYNDGTIVTGFIQSVNINYTPAYINLCKSITKKGDSPDHHIKFDRIIKLVIKPYNKEVEVYE
jgi:hypothetical protein|tara:strand:+ start:316 stop:573 length:258 start_codon:yes stop_codon:yes gene_type:complete